MRPVSFHFVKLGRKWFPKFSLLIFMVVLSGIAGRNYLIRNLVKGYWSTVFELAEAEYGTQASAEQRACMQQCFRSMGLGISFGIVAG